MFEEEYKPSMKDRIKIAYYVARAYVELAYNSVDSFVEGLKDKLSGK